ncbi:MAG: glycosyltransferase [Thermoguttaceae bacterium]
MDEPKTARQQMRRIARSALQRLGLYPLASRVWRRARSFAARWSNVCKELPADVDAPPYEDIPAGYDIICLPVIPWNSRFQRPQQLMREWAARGHRVFYASVVFHDDCEARVRQVGNMPGVSEMALPSPRELNVYGHLPSAADVARMVAAIDTLRRQRRIAAAVVVVQLPFWTALAERLRQQFGWPVVYDCMDDHSGFSTNSDEMLEAEEQTIATADLVVVTSDVLKKKVERRAKRTALIRNACDYEHFAAVSPLPSGEEPEVRALPTVGFYGAIAEWFDAELVAQLAASRPNWRFELIGSTYTGDVSRLAKLPNVALLGEKPYAELPRLMASWHCCIIPFKRIPLTEATNPVKAYEMLAAGKPVVAVDLPELRSLAEEGLVALADDAAGFAAAIEAAIAQDGAMPRERRRAFAAANTWRNRCDVLDEAVCSLFPLASIVVVTYNNLALNQECLGSISRHTDWPNYEVIVVDNASTDGTPEWLRELADKAVFGQRLQVICNGENRGFSGANNQGMRAARGQFLCLLNNDTVVTRGWLSTLIGHLRARPDVGLVGPVSNRVGNEAKVPVEYNTPEEMPRWAAKYCWRHDGETFPIEMLGFFCVVFPREVCERVGELDERFGVGCFEDDDYCRRAREKGYQILCARDAFVHHWLEASFQLLARQQYLDIFHENKRRYEAKWAARQHQSEDVTIETQATGLTIGGR